MSEAGSTPTFGSRLGRAISNLLLAVLNATLVLFIVAAIAGIVLIGKARTFASDIAGDVTQAAISSTGLQPADALSELRMVSTEIRDLKVAIAERGTDVDQRVAQLSARLDSVQATIDGLRSRKVEMTDAVIDRAGVALGNAMRSLRDCVPAGS